MAEFGLRHPCFKKNGSDTGVILGKAVVANLTVNLASGELYADDGLAEQLSEFSNGSLAMETDNLSDQVAADIYGADVTDGVVTYNKNDNPPEGVLGYYKVLMIAGIRKYRAYIYPRARAALGNDNGQTRGSSITFQTAQTTWTIFSDDAGNWRKTKEFGSAEEAQAFVDEHCGTSEEQISANAALSELRISSCTLTPAFDADVTAYTTTTSNATNTINATARESGATIVIKNGNTVVANGNSATWADGENTVTVKVTNGSAERTYTVTVTKSAA